MANSKVTKTYESVNAWRRRGDGRLVLYRCFRVLPDGGFCVQSADFFDPPVTAEAWQQSEAQFSELLAEQAPDERSDLFVTLEEAIEAHEADFAWADDPSTGEAAAGGVSADGEGED